MCLGFRDFLDEITGMIHPTQPMWGDYTKPSNMRIPIKQSVSCKARGVFFVAQVKKKRGNFWVCFCWLGSKFCWVGLGGWAKVFVGLIFCFG